MTDIKLVALYNHWCAADSINYHLRRSNSVSPDVPDDMSPEVAATAMEFSTMQSLQVYYALIYVVIEGYQECSYIDDVIDDLLTKEEFVQLLRRFRNAVFHYQKDLLPEKLVNFLTKEESEKWISDLNAAFKAFFFKELDLENVVKRLDK